MNELKDKLRQLHDRVEQAWLSLELAGKESHLRDLESLMSQPEFWNDRATAEKVSTEAGQLRRQLEVWRLLRADIADTWLMMDDPGDEALVAELSIMIDGLLSRYTDLETQLWLRGPHDNRPAIVTIYAGAGGVDAQDWAQMLERMYLRYAEISSFHVDVLNRTIGQEAGIKNVTMKISGEFAYGFLKTESGVHRLVRLSPYDADQQRHTSFAMVEVLPELEETEDIKIDDKDLRLDVYRSSGKGGQSVNTTDSAVRITHIPTGIVVTCQNERSQMQNKEQARKYLLGKLQVYYQAEKDEERQALRGELTEAAWGNQIRSYVLHPYKMVKDHRTKYETKEPERVLNGEIHDFIEQRLAQEAGMLESQKSKGKR